MTPERPSDPPLQSGPGFTYTDEGDGPLPIVMLHGLPGSVRDYRWLAPALRARIIRIDQPGFGGTPRQTAPDPSLAGRARFVIGACEALGLSRYAVLGHSMGGPLAIAVASLSREVCGLALLASVGLRPHRLVRKVGLRPDLPRLLALPPIRAALLPALRKGFVRAGFPSSTPDAAILQCTRILNTLSFPAIRERAREVRCPTFVAWADDDPLVEGTIGLELAGNLPAGPRLVFETGGHNIQKSRAIELGDAIGRWLAEL